ncbi:Rho guanine nucleotide exchange factor, putative, partial [Entamoeba nuttalli P19]
TIMSLQNCLIKQLSEQQEKVFQRIFDILHNDDTYGRGLDIINERLEQPSFREMLYCAHSGFISHLICCPRLEDWTTICICVIHILDDLFTSSSFAEYSILYDPQLIVGLTDALNSSFSMSSTQVQELLHFIANIICDNTNVIDSFNPLLSPLMAIVEPSNQNRILASSAITNIIQPTNSRGQVMFLKAHGIEKAVQMLTSSDEFENITGCKLLYQLLIQPDERVRSVFVKILFAQELFLPTMTSLMSRAKGELAELLMAITYGISLVRGHELEFLESGLIYELFNYLDYPFNDQTTQQSFTWAVNALFSCLYEKRLYPHMKMVGLTDKITNLLKHYQEFDTQIVSSLFGIVRYLISYEGIQMEFMVLDCVHAIDTICQDSKIGLSTKNIGKSIIQVLNNDKNIELLKKIKETMAAPTPEAKRTESERLLVVAKQAQQEQHKEQEVEESTQKDLKFKLGINDHTGANTRRSIIGSNRIHLPSVAQSAPVMKKSNRMSVTDLKTLLGQSNPNEEQMKILSEFNLKKAKRFHIIQEMYTTEKTYVESMKQCLDVMFPFFQQNLPEDVDILFSNFKDVYEIHTRLFKKISERWLSQKEEAFVSIADIFIEFFNWKEVYDAYARYLVEADDGIQFDFSEKPKIIKDQLTAWAGQCLILANFLILPVQRLPRYVLLLESLLKATPPIEEYDYLKQALDDGRGLTVRLNSAKKVIQDKKFLSHYNDVIIGIEPNSQRQFIREGTLNIKEKSKAIYQCVLMSDAFFVLTQNKKNRKLYDIRFVCKKGDSHLVDNKKMKKIKDITDVITFAIPDGKKEKTISLLFGFGSDFEGWSSSINSVFRT